MPRTASAMSASCPSTASFASPSLSLSRSSSSPSARSGSHSAERRGDAGIQRAAAADLPRRPAAAGLSSSTVSKIDRAECPAVEPVRGVDLDFPFEPHRHPGLRPGGDADRIGIDAGDQAEAVEAGGEQRFAIGRATSARSSCVAAAGAEAAIPREAQRGLREHARFHRAASKLWSFAATSPRQGAR